MSDDDSPRVVVVGGGVAGLTAARLLRKEGMAIVLVEREQRFGGRLLTHAPTPDGPRFDLGPQYLCGAAWGRGPDADAVLPPPPLPVPGRATGSRLRRSPRARRRCPAASSPLV